MNIYKYDKETKEYIGTIVAEIDQLESKKQNKDVYLIPANATDIKPPIVGENEVAVFSKTWKIKPDFRGQYIVGSDMQPMKINEIGDIPKGYVLISNEEIELLNEKGSNYFVIIGKHLVINNNYEQEQTKKEQERIGNLSMTRGDVFEAIILAKSKTKSELRTMIENYSNLTDLERALYLNRFDEALDFYRKHPAIDLIGGLLGINSEQMNKFFETKDWHELV